MSVRGSSYDVVVVGYGGAGASAAIEAHDAGAHVLIIEKSTPGGSTQVAGGNIRSVKDHEKMVRHLHALCEGATDLASVEAHVTGLQELPAWIERLGGVIKLDERTPESISPRPTPESSPARPSRS